MSPVTLDPEVHLEVLKAQRNAAADEAAYYRAAAFQEAQRADALSDEVARLRALIKEETPDGPREP